MSVKRIAILHPHSGDIGNLWARHINAGAQQLGIEAAEFSDSWDIGKFDPDFVLAMSHQDPKLTRYPTFGVLIQPWRWYQTPRFMRNILTYDAYFTVSDQLKQWIEDVSFGARKLASPVGFFTPSLHSGKSASSPKPIAFLACCNPLREDQHSYELSRLLSTRPYMRFYGPPEHLAQIDESAYYGNCSLDSCFDLYCEAGAGLCLDHPDFIEVRLPSFRILQMAAASSAIICSRNPFVERWFGDSVLYVEHDCPPEVMAWQIDQHYKWLQQNAPAAQEMASKCHEAFINNLSIEKLLPNILELHDRVSREKSYSIPFNEDPAALPSVAYIVRLGEESVSLLDRSLRSLRSQYYPNLHVLLILKKDQSLDLAGFEDLRIEILHCNEAGSSHALWEGLRRVRARNTTLFGILNPGDELYANHVRTLIRTLDYHEGRTWFGSIGLSYSGTSEFSEEGFLADRLPDKLTIERMQKLRIYQFHFYQPDYLDEDSHILHTSSFLAKTSLLDDELMIDPELEVGEDSYLWLLLAEKTLFAFSCELTSCKHVLSSKEADPVGYKKSQIRTFFRTLGRSFPSAKIYMLNVDFKGGYEHSTEYDLDLLAPMILTNPRRSESILELGKLMPAEGVADQDGILHVPSEKRGPAVRLKPKMLGPGSYQIKWYFLPGPNVDLSKPLFELKIACDPNEFVFSSREIRIAEGERVGPVWCAALAFDTPLDGGVCHYDFSLFSCGNGEFRVLGAKFERLPKKLICRISDLNPQRPIWIYGAGEGGRIVMKKLQRHGLFSIAGFIDKSKKGVFEGRQIINLQTALPLLNENTTVLIASMYWQDIANELNQHGVPNVYSAYPYRGDNIYILS